MREATGKRRRRAIRLRRGEAIAAGFALALFILMFAGWYGSEVVGQVAEIEFDWTGGSAWQALDWIPVFLTLTVAVAIGAAVLRVAGSDWKPVVPLNAAVAVLGGLATLSVLFRILVPPDFGTLGGVDVEATLRLPVFLALGAAFGVAYGGYSAMREEESSFAAVAESLQPRRGKPASRRRSRSSSG